MPYRNRPAADPDDDIPDEYYGGPPTVGPGEQDPDDDYEPPEK